MKNPTPGLYPSRNKTRASIRTLFNAASAFLIVAASAGWQASSATPRSSTPPSTSLTGCTPLCNGGNCTPIMLADIWPSKNVALTENDVLFSGGAYPYINNGYVAKVPKAGGQIEFILDDLATIPTVRQTGGEIYVLGASSPLPSLLNRLNSDGSYTGFPTATGWPNSFTGDATRLYWVDSNDGNFYSVPRTGGSLELVAQSGTPTKPYQAHVDEEYLYWVNQPLSKKGWTLWKAPKSGGAAPTLLLSVLAGRFRKFVLDGNDIYFIDYYTGLNKISKNGGAVTHIAYADDPGSMLAVDDERLYWIKDEVFTATCKDGSSSQSLTAETYLTEDIAVDDSGIYWTQFYKVWKLAK